MKRIGMWNRMRRIMAFPVDLVSWIFLGRRRVIIKKRNTKTTWIRLRDGNVVKVKNRRMM